MTHKIVKDWTTLAGLRAIIIQCIFEPNIQYPRINHFCGYIGVTKEHPAFGKGYSEQCDFIQQSSVDSATVGKKSEILLLTAMVNSDEEGGKIRRSLDILIDVHGGISYSSIKSPSDYPMATEDTWWFGFDCAHYQDDYPDGGQPLEYVITGCESMAKQFKELT